MFLTKIPIFNYQYFFGGLNFITILCFKDMKNILGCEKKKKIPLVNKEKKKKQI
jgi:hypothetical protein